MAEEKEKVTNQETDRPSEGKNKELSQEELDKVTGGKRPDGAGGGNSS